MASGLRSTPHALLDDTEIERILASPVSASLAFVDRDGFPRIVPCWFVWFDNAFHTTSDPAKFHVRRLRLDPRASFCVEVSSVLDNGLRRNRQVKGVGRAEVFGDGVGVGQRIWTKYLGDEMHRALPSERLVIRLKPKSLSAHGGDLKVSANP